MNRTFGYVRVSSADQNEAGQVAAMMKNGIEDNHIFIDKMSGKNFERPEYRRMLRKVRESDLIVFQSIDRMGRNYSEIKEQWRILTQEKKVNVCVLDMPILDTRQGKNLTGIFIGDLVLQILSYCAETEREAIRKRQKEDIEAVKKNHVRFGRPLRDLPDCFESYANEWIEGRMTCREAAEACGIPVSTFRDRTKRMKER